MGSLEFQLFEFDVEVVKMCAPLWGEQNVGDTKIACFTPPFSLQIYSIKMTGLDTVYTERTGIVQWKITHTAYNEKL